MSALCREIAVSLQEKKEQKLKYSDDAMTAPYNKIIHSIDRMCNCCLNILDAVQSRDNEMGLTYFLEDPTGEQKAIEG